MKVGIDARMMGEKQTGIGNYIKNLINGLKEDRENVYYVFLLPEEFAVFEESVNFRKIKVISRWYTLSEQIVFLRDLNRMGLDLVHFPHFNVPIAYRGKFIVTIHDVTQNFYGGNKGLVDIKKWAYRRVFQSAVIRARAIIAVSDYTKKDLVSHFEVDGSKIETIYEGLDLQFKVQATTEEVVAVKKKYQLPEQYILYAGVWRRHKNILGLIRTFYELKKRFKIDYKLVLLGEEHPRYAVVEEAIERLKLREEIICPGFLPYTDLPAVFKGASLYVLPSFREGFGFTPIEAMSQGVAVASSQETCLPEILQDAASYFNPRSIDDMVRKIHELLVNKKLQAKFISKGYKLSEKYNWASTIKHTKQIYNKVYVGSRASG